MEDRQHGFKKVTPLVLPNHLAGIAEIVDLLKINDKIGLHDEVIYLQVEDSLKIFLLKINNRVEELR